MKTWNTLLAVVLVASLLGGCRGGGFFLDPDEADEELGLPGSGYSRFGSQIAYEHSARGEVLANRGEPEQAIKEFETALETDPWDFFLRGRLAELYIEIGQPAQAKRHIERILRRDQSSEFGWLALAKYHDAKGQTEKAINAAKKAIRVEPSSSKAALWLAAYFAQAGEHGLAMEVLKRVVLADPMNAEARLGLAEALLELGKPFEAKDHLVMFSRLRPFRFDVIEKIATLSLQAGDRSGAAELLEIAIGKNPSNETARIQLIGLHIELNLFDRALKHLDSLQPVKTGDLEGGIERACLYAKVGETYQARTILVDLSGTNPEQPQSRLALAEIEIELGRLENARLLIETTNDDWTEEQIDARLTLLDQLQAWPAHTTSCSFSIN